MEFRVLGPLEVRHHGQALELRGSTRRAVLALLVLHANEVVRSDRLIEELWDERPSANASAAPQNHISADLASPSDAFGHRTVRAAFDNFLIAAEYRRCG